ncbi:hypothetical protein CS0771_02490 [Catellatospora sp. IY07-71]|uniref:hypothetical protein n=1 Tax=Catellatospora sp. IY07-71 TaxID=2728827 RepID=UPI001BB3FA56|nr:hypothetical protein [Catellatospora sp. IY07-71]BCJ70705.1 hypothetical protein CS0771_02490 [Catellatospora sp. IY07-71]
MTTPRPRRVPRQRRPDHDTDEAEPATPPTGPLVRYLTDPDIEADIQAFVDTAPPMSEVKRAKIARLLGTDKPHHNT